MTKTDNFALFEQITTGTIRQPYINYNFKFLDYNLDSLDVYSYLLKLKDAFDLDDEAFEKVTIKTFRDVFNELVKADILENKII